MPTVTQHNKQLYISSQQEAAEKQKMLTQNIDAAPPSV
jgi:hypothetical protein